MTDALFREDSYRRTLEATVDGIEINYVGNSNGMQHDLQVISEKGWKVIKTPVWRVIASLKCQGSK